MCRGAGSVRSAFWRRPRFACPDLHRGAQVLLKRTYGRDRRDAGR